MGDWERYTLIVPLIPHPTAMISPQYLSLHQETHQPPSASRLPIPALFCGLCWRPCWSACDTRETEVASRVALVCVGVVRATVCECETRDGEGTDCRFWTLTSSEICQVVREG